MIKILSLMLYIICLSSQTAHAQQFGLYTGNSWRVICDVTDPSERVIADAICEHYTQGVIEAWLLSFELRNTHTFCIEKTHTTQQHIQVIKNFMVANPSNLHRPAAFLILEAMMKAFPTPCVFDR